MNDLMDCKMIDEYKEHVSTVLYVIGHPEAIVTDLSVVGDFTMNLSEPDISKILKNLSYLTDDNIKESHKIWELAQMIYYNQPTCYYPCEICGGGK